MDYNRITLSVDIKKTMVSLRMSMKYRLSCLACASPLVTLVVGDCLFSSSLARVLRVVGRGSPNDTQDP